MPPDKDFDEQLYKLTAENQRLLTENNELLKKIRRSSIIGFWFKLIWTMVILGIPFVLYFYVIEPYFDKLGSSFDEFREGMQEVPGWKQFYEAVRGDDEAEVPAE